MGYGGLDAGYVSFHGKFSGLMFTQCVNFPLFVHKKDLPISNFIKGDLPKF